MIKFIDVTGKTEDEAIQSALRQLQMDRDDVSVEILERAKSGFLGIGSTPARVRVSYDDGMPEETAKPVEKPAAPKPEKKAEAKPAAPLYAPEILQKKDSRPSEQYADHADRSERRDRPRRDRRDGDRRQGGFNRDRREGGCNRGPRPAGQGYNNNRGPRPAGATTPKEGGAQ